MTARLDGTVALVTTHAALPQLLDAAEDGPRRVAGLVNVSSVAACQVGPVAPRSVAGWQVR